jgi:3-deoxy-D-manno-octulosonic-acid transferase
MYFFYSLLMVFYGAGLIVVLYIRAWRRGKSVSGIRERLGFLPESLRHDGRLTFWFHSCSVGETLSVQPLAHALRRSYPEARLVFSTTTDTGQALARERFTQFGAGNVFYFPIDMASVVRRVLDWIRPTMVIIVDTEIWPNLTHHASRRGIPVVLANGRISESSFRRYLRIRPVLLRVFQSYRILMVASQEEAERFRQLGAPAGKILVTGNLKHDRNLVEQEVAAAQFRGLQEAFGLQSNSTNLIVAGSTHAGEEDVLLEVLGSLRRVPGLEATRLLLVPRHPRRFESVARDAALAGFQVTRRSRSKPATPGAEVLLLDTVGELAAAYGFASVAFVGGTLVRHGGQNIMEPAAHKRPIVIGPSMENFAQVLAEFRAHDAVVQIDAGTGDRAGQVRQLTDVFVRLLQNPAECERLGNAAHSVFASNLGATSRTAAKIAEILNAAPFPRQTGADSPASCTSESPERNQKPD